MTEQNDLLLDPDFEVKERPPSRWRNKWWSHTGAIRSAQTGIATRGDANGVCWSSMTHPSYEIAETKAREANKRDMARGVRPAVWLGAFPVEGDA